jgi:hypothetical protein
MAGIEPASGRFVPRTSTSVVDCDLSPNRLPSTKGSVRPAAGARKPLFPTVSGVWWGTLALCRPSHHRLEIGDRWTWPNLLGQLLLSHCTRQPEAEQRSQCGWHLKVRADFSRSAPLGSQSGTSLNRRSRSSPGKALYHTNKWINVYLTLEKWYLLISRRCPTKRS